MRIVRYQNICLIFQPLIGSCSACQIMILLREILCYNHLIYPYFVSKNAIYMSFNRRVHCTASHALKLTRIKYTVSLSFWIFKQIWMKPNKFTKSNKNLSIKWNPNQKQLLSKTEILVVVTITFNAPPSSSSILFYDYLQTRSPLMKWSNQSRILKTGFRKTCLPLLKLWRNPNQRLKMISTVLKHFWKINSQRACKLYTWNTTANSLSRIITGHFQQRKLKRILKSIK